jgi:hypothetical protein
MKIIVFLLSLLESPFVDLVIPVIADKLGLDAKKLKDFIQWLADLAPDEQAAVAVQLASRGFGDCGPDCPCKEVLEALKEVA